jgi:hypothetical protein
MERESVMSTTAVEIPGYVVPLDGGGVLVGDRVQVFIEIEAVLNPPQPANA